MGGRAAAELGVRANRSQGFEHLVLLGSVDEPLLDCEGGGTCCHEALGKGVIVGLIVLLLSGFRSFFWFKEAYFLRLTKEMLKA